MYLQSTTVPGKPIIIEDGSQVVVIDFAGWRTFFPRTFVPGCLILEDFCSQTFVPRRIFVHRTFDIRTLDPQRNFAALEMKTKCSWLKIPPCHTHTFIYVMLTFWLAVKIASRIPSLVNPPWPLVSRQPFGVHLLCLFWNCLTFFRVFEVYYVSDLKLLLLTRLVDIFLHSLAFYSHIRN